MIDVKEQMSICVVWITSFNPVLIYEYTNYSDNKKVNLREPVQ
jgi:hypothetical protein